MGNSDKHRDDSTNPKQQRIRSDHELQILLNEYNLCNGRIEAFMARQDKMLQMSLVIVGGAVAFTLLRNIADELYIIIPIIPLMIFSHVFYHYSRNIVDLGYRKYLELKLNEFFPDGVVQKINYSSLGRKYNLYTNPMSKFNIALVPIIILLSMGYSTIMSDYNLVVFVLNLFLFGVAIWMVGSFYKHTKNIDKKVLADCWLMKDEYSEFLNSIKEKDENDSTESLSKSIPRNK